MATTAQPRAPEEPGRFRWLRSVRGRRLAIVISVGLIALIGIAIWRMRSADELPDIGDPFDVAEWLRRVDLPDEQNAYAVYATAPRCRLQLWEALPKVDFEHFHTLTWSTAGPEVRAVVEQRRPALEKWREGSERPDALEFQPEQILRSGSRWFVSRLTEDMCDLARLAALEGSRREEAGAMGQAWDWYRAMLRFSRLVGRHGGARYYGVMVHEQAANRILHWAADPRVDARLFRKALEETLAADALTTPPSEYLEFAYLVLVRGDWEQFLRDFGRPVPPLPGGENGLLDQMTSLVGVRVPARMAWLRASNDVDRSRRALKLLYANWLAQIDRPAAKRAPIAIKEPVWIYAADPTAPPAARAVAPERLARAVERNGFAKAVLFPYRSEDAHHAPWWEENGGLARERRRRSVLIVRLAAEWYRREHGQLPAKAEALVGPYLKELPEGIAPGDPIPTGVE